MSFSRIILSRVANLLPMRTQSRLKWMLMIPDQLAALEHMRDAGFDARVIVDVGAYVGKFAQMVQTVWPASRVIMFEPQPDKQAGLEALVRSNPHIALRQAVLGATTGEDIEFRLHESASSMKQFRSDPGVPSLKLKTIALDEALQGTPFEKPDLVKIDVQGAEMEVIAGGQRTIDAAQAVILELSVVEEYSGAPLFHEMINFMGQRGFRVYDICTIWRNSINKSMIEADVIFARPDCPAFAGKNYWTSERA